MNNKTFKKILFMAILLLFIINISGCQVGTIKLNADNSFVYNGSRYNLIDEDFEYYVDYQEPEVGCIRSMFFPGTYLYSAKGNDNLIYSVYGTGYANNLFDEVWVKEGYSFPDKKTPISYLYLIGELSDEKYYLTSDNKSFNELFLITTSIPDNYKYINLDAYCCLCLVYEDELLDQTITKVTRWLIEDEYGNFYFTKIENRKTVWYTLSDELTYQVRKIFS